MKSKEDKAAKLLGEKKIEKNVETDKRIHFTVIGDTEAHSVIFDKEKKRFSCDCKFFALQEKECSHILACKLKEGL